MDVQQLLSSFRRRWKFLVALFLVGVGVAVAITSVIPKTYASSTRVYVSASAINQQDEPWNMAFYASQRVSSFAALVKDPAMLERIAERDGVSLTPQELDRQITAAPIPDSVIVAISVESGSPGVAQAVAGAAAEVLIELVKELETPDPTTDNAEPVAPISARVIGEPAYNENPVSPNVPLNLTVGGLLGLLAGIAGALIRESLDKTVRSPDVLSEITGASVMAVVPFDSSVKKHPLITDPLAGLSRGEPYRVLRTNLQFVDVDSQQQIFVLTSPVADEGKTVTAVNLALAMTEAGRSVLLIDADLRKSSIASLLGLDPSVGIMTALMGRADLDSCIQTHASGLRVLATGPLPPNPAEVLDTDAVRSLLEQAGRRFDAVIIDAPPVLPVADATILAATVGGVLLVVRLGKTPAEHVRQAAERLHAVGAPIHGVVASMAPGQATGAYVADDGSLYRPAPAQIRERESRRASTRART